MDIEIGQWMSEAGWRFDSPAEPVGCGTGGEIFGSGVYDDTISAQLMRGGLYSHGEISSHDVTSSRELHNQTMTLTVFCES